MAILRSDGRAWRDRVVVVTGGTSGIGREFALRLAAQGAKVVACARNEVALRELHTRCPQIEAIRCDVTVTSDVLALEAAIQDRYGRVDVLINNAGTITGQFTGSVSAWLGTNWMSPGMKFRLSRKIRVTRQLSEHIERFDIVGREPPRFPEPLRRAGWSGEYGKDTKPSCSLNTHAS